jgi:hypothetical protein
LLLCKGVDAMAELPGRILLAAMRFVRKCGLAGWTASTTRLIQAHADMQSSAKQSAHQQPLAPPVANKRRASASTRF